MTTSKYLVVALLLASAALSPIFVFRPANAQVTGDSQIVAPTIVDPLAVPGTKVSLLFNILSVGPDPEDLDAWQMAGRVNLDHLRLDPPKVDVDGFLTFEEINPVFRSRCNTIAGTYLPTILIDPLTGDFFVTSPCLTLRTDSATFRTGLQGDFTPALTLTATVLKQAVSVIDLSTVDTFLRDTSGGSITPIPATVTDGSFDNRVADITPPTASYIVTDAAPGGDADGVFESGETLTFDGSASSDNVGVVSWTWNFGDGSLPVTEADPVTTHLYTVTTDTTFPTSLTVKDAAGNSGSATKGVLVKAPPPAFNYSLSVNPMSGGDVIQGGSTSTMVTATLVGGPTRSVTITASQPSGVTCTPASNPVTPTASYQLTCNVASNAAEGPRTVTLTGSADDVPGDDGETATFSFNVVKHNTATAIDCVPADLIVGGVPSTTTCTATVTDTSAIPTTPTGTVSFSVSIGGGPFSPLASCTLDSTGKCSVNYTPIDGTARTDTIRGDYNGDGTHNTSFGSDTVNVGVRRETITTVSCTPDTVVMNQATVCTATVTPKTGPGVPSGSVSFSVSPGTGSFSPMASCTLDATGKCSVQYTPGAGTAPRTDRITGSYGGNGQFASSSGFADVTVNKRATSTDATCSVTSVVVNQAVSCKATVKDISPGTAITPAGSVSFTSSGPGSFGPVTCVTVSGALECTVSYTPALNAAALPRTDAITGSYSGDASHNTSSGSTNVNVEKREATTVVTCIGPAVIDQATGCAAFVSDQTSPGTSIVPIGTVTFSTSGTGFFDPVTCTLSEFIPPAPRCGVLYTPTGVVPPEGRIDIITATYSGDLAHNGDSDTQALPVLGPFTCTIISIFPTVIFETEPVEFKADCTGGTAPYSFSWSFGDGTSGTGSSVTHTYAGQGMFTVTVTGTDSSSLARKDDATRTVNVYDEPGFARGKLSWTHHLTGATQVWSKVILKNNSPFDVDITVRISLRFDTGAAACGVQGTPDCPTATFLLNANSGVVIFPNAISFVPQVRDVKYCFDATTTYIAVNLPAGETSAVGTGNTKSGCFAAV